MGAPLEAFNGSSPSADFSTGANAIERFASFFAEDKGTHKVMESLTAAVVVKEVDLTSPAVWIHASLMFETEYRLRHITSEAEEEDFDFPHMSMVEKANIIQNAFIMVYTWLETQLPMPWNRSVGWSVCHWLLANYLEHHADEDFQMSRENGASAAVVRLQAFRVAVRENAVNTSFSRDEYRLIVTGDRFTLSGRVPSGESPTDGRWVNIDL